MLENGKKQQNSQNVKEIGMVAMTLEIHLLFTNCNIGCNPSMPRPQSVKFHPPKNLGN